MGQNVQPTPTFQGNLTSAPLTGAALVLKGAPGRVYRLIVLVAGSAAGKVHNAATTGAAVDGTNQISTIPNTVGTVTLDAACNAGIVITPGTGQTLVVTYS